MLFKKDFAVCLSTLFCKPTIQITKHGFQSYPTTKEPPEQCLSPIEIYKLNTKISKEIGMYENYQSTIRCILLLSFLTTSSLS